MSSQNSLLSSQCVIHNCTNIVFASRCGVIPVLRHWDDKKGESFFKSSCKEK
ncbi:hypothetical protein [Wolbachia endosymbiont (group A) of Apoderus coryli]|uniref:hypothetical protein n=1 Tax=Wolbachia endosymbiont (group A) of Apoderus coryli TaxID=2953980 RepID=UPI00222F9FCF|nr:hypothetical protein [Wolbachia endosymbiont (group A) of Apoderus coryli]